MRIVLFCALVAGGCIAAPTELSQPLLGGTPTAPGEFPATGALRVSWGGEPPQLLCAATLVSATVAVTAAHCFLGLGDRLPELALADDLATPDSALRVRARAVHVHPQFDVQPAAGAPGHDLAVVVLEAPITSVPVATLGDGADRLSVVAYGPLVQDGPGGRKNVATVEVVEAGASELTVSAADSTACTGDSGGAAYADTRLAAIVSRADDASRPCSGGTRMTRLDAHADWIGRQIAAASGCAVAGPRANDRPPILPLLAFLVLVCGRVFSVIRASSADPAAGRRADRRAGAPWRSALAARPTRRARPDRPSAARVGAAPPAP